MGYIFSGCKSLVEVPEFDTYEVKNMDSMFFYCTSLKEVPKLDTSKVKDMSHMFFGCSSLEKVPENFPSYDWTETCSKAIKENYPEFFI
jgi:surface protein